MSNEFNKFLPDNPCGMIELAESQYEWSTPQEHPGCDLLVQRTSALMVHGIWKKEIPRTSRAIAKVTNILKVRATLSTRSRVNHGFENPGIEYLLTKWHRGMLSRMVARIITLGTQSMATLLG